MEGAYRQKRIDRKPAGKPSTVAEGTSKVASCPLARTTIFRHQLNNEHGQRDGKGKSLPSANKRKKGVKKSPYGQKDEARISAESPDRVSYGSTPENSRGGGGGTIQVGG